MVAFVGYFADARGGVQAYPFNGEPVAQPNHTTTDTDGDGFPDPAELLDETQRSFFRRWFVSIAQSQFYYVHPHWPDVRRDCTGLICFAYKEALKNP